MASVLLYLQLYRMDMGELLCISEEASMGKPRFPARTDASDLRFGSSCDPHQHDRSKRESVADLSLRNARCDCAGIYHGRGNGKALPCKILGLQPAETESERIYLCEFIPLLGSFFGAPRTRDTCSCRAGSSGYPPGYYRRGCACAHCDHVGGPDTVVQRGYGSEACPYTA